MWIPVTKIISTQGINYNLNKQQISCRRFEHRSIVFLNIWLFPVKYITSPYYINASYRMQKVLFYINTNNPIFTLIVTIIKNTAYNFYFLFIIPFFCNSAASHLHLTTSPYLSWAWLPNAINKLKIKRLVSSFRILDINFPNTFRKINVLKQLFKVLLKVHN